MYTPVNVLEKATHGIHWVPNIQTNPLFPASKPNLLLNNRKQNLKKTVIK